MLQVPRELVCSSYEAALVHIEDEQYVCRLLTVGPIAHSRAPLTFKADLSVAMGPVARSSAVAFDTVHSESFHIRVTARQEMQVSTSMRAARVSRYQTAICDSGADEDVREVRVCVPIVLYDAEIVVLEGRRVSLRSDQERLYAHLVGKLITVGCILSTGDAHTYRVASMELKRGYRGVARVTGSTRIKINDIDRISRGPVGHMDPPAEATCLIGLRAAQDDLTAVAAAVLRAPQVATASLHEKFSGLEFGVLLHGPKGCGISQLIVQCAAANEMDIVEWSPSSVVCVARSAAHSTPLPQYLPTTLLRIRDAHLVFPASDPAYSGMALRLLLREVERRVRRGPYSVFLVGDTSALSEAHSPSMETLFSVRIAVSLPDAGARAQLIASVRGGEVGEWTGAAQCMAGLTCAEVLRAAAAPTLSHHFAPPFKQTTWGDIGGLEDVKKQLIDTLIMPRRHRDVYKRFGLSSPRGVLLYGPPGCAKTTLVRALCTEGNLSLVYLDSANLISAFVGESERQLRDAFARAAQLAPCLIFFDEVEVLGAQRTSSSSGSHEDNARLLSTLLIEMDGFSAQCDVCFVGATNAPHLLDSALLRPGRLDYLVYIPLPCLADRRKIFETAFKSADVKGLDLDQLSAATEGFSGADLSSLCKDILLDAIDEGVSGPSSCTVLLSQSRCLALARAFKRTEYSTAAMEAFRDSTAGPRS